MNPTGLHALINKRATLVQRAFYAQRLWGCLCRSCSGIWLYRHMQRTMPWITNPNPDLKSSIPLASVTPWQAP